MNQAESAVRSVFKFEGRRNQLSYFVYMVAIFAIAMVASLLVGALSVVTAGLAGILFVVVLVATSVASLLVGAQRIRDFGYSGCWVFLWFLPYVGVLLMIAMCFIPSTVGDNKYGPDLSQPRI